MRFVLVPQFLYLVSGATLVLLVFACLWRTRSRLKEEGLKTDRVDVTAARVGVVAVLYMVPATCQVCVLGVCVCGLGAVWVCVGGMFVCV